MIHHMRELTLQPRQNVLFEAGLAFGRFGDSRTILVRVGDVRPFSDLLGRYEVRLTNEAQTRIDLVHRLEDAGCDVDQTGRDWVKIGDFSAVAETPRNYPKLYVIDWSKPPGSLTYHRVIVVESSAKLKKAFHMGQQKGHDCDNWARICKIPIIPGEGDRDYHEFLANRGITCTHKRPPSTDWLDKVLKRATPRPD
jgi:hypothetical protein